VRRAAQPARADGNRAQHDDDGHHDRDRAVRVVHDFAFDLAVRCAIGFAVVQEVDLVRDVTPSILPRAAALQPPRRSGW
jgi:hypothetical protein